MHFELSTLFAVGVGYLLVLFLIAYTAERGRLPAGLARHPLTYTLSLGVYATSWSFYGSVGFAQTQGWHFLTIYLGVTLAFFLTPVLLMPLLRLTREYQLTSLADVFAFRYRSQAAGVLVTLFMLAGTLPYLALQIRAVTASLHTLTQTTAPNVLALGFCLTLILFAILFGARHVTPREKHEGLVVAIAFESLIKLVALLALGGFAVFGVFGGPGGLDQWLEANPQALDALYAPVQQGPWASLLLLSFAAAFLLPRQFHMAFTENIEPRTLTVASWAFPLLLLLFNIAIPPILWAGTAMQLPGDADYYGLTMALVGGQPVLTTLAFIGGISAASAMMIVTSLALAAMCLNHLLLPVSLPQRLVSGTNIYRWLLWGRRTLIAIVILAGYGFFLLLERNQGLVQLGLISFVAVAQFLPGIVGLLYWRRATRAGFLAGLLGGATLWCLTLLLPLLKSSGLITSSPDLMALIPVGGSDKWQFATFWTLLLNSGLFVGVSLLTRQSDAERHAAQACCSQSIAPPVGAVRMRTVPQFHDQLERIMGEDMAQLEVQRALDDLGMHASETRPTELRRLRERIERNLSGLIGPSLAHMIVDERLQLDATAQVALADSMRFIEERLEASRSELKGLAAELDALRRYHRQVLHDLPMGVCSVSPTQEILNWNVAMRIVSAIDPRDAIGKSLQELPEPWSGMLSTFLKTSDRHLHKVHVIIDGHQRWFNLHKAAIEGPQGDDRSRGTVLLLEDLTELQILESELTHSERLASIGRLAAGVAHEIGNPVTSIACLAQDLPAESDSQSVRDGLSQILEQTRRIGDIVQSLVRFSHSGSDPQRKPEPLDVADCIDEAMRLVRLGRDARELVLSNHVAHGVTIHGDRQRLLQVFVNLLSNACDVSRPGDEILATAENKGDQLHLRICDEGEGIREEHLDRIFEPFFTTKEPGAGTGLGLAVAYSIVQEHGGSLWAESEAGTGTCFNIALPVTHSNESVRAGEQL